MPSKVLLKKDWKQVSLLWMILVFLGLIAFTVPVWTQMERFDEEIRNIQLNPENFSVPTEFRDDIPVEALFDPTSVVAYNLGNIGTLIPIGTVVFLFVVFAALMASTLIGAERNSHMSDFSMSLPFTRTQLYISKWLIGVSGIISATIVGGISMYLLIRSSVYAFLLEGELLNILVVLGFLVLLGISFYSLALWMGSFGGESISQVAWSFVALIFPMGILGLIQGSIYGLSNGTNTSTNWFEEAFESLPLRILSPLANLINLNTWELFTSGRVWDDFVMITIPCSIGFIVLSFGLGLWMYNRAPQENNGRFFMFSNWLWLVHLIIVSCFAMLGGIIFTQFSYQASRGLYLIGFVVVAFLGHLLAKRLLYRFNLKLKS